MAVARLPRLKRIEHISAHPVYNFAVESQVRPLPWLALNAGVSLNLPTQYDTRNYYPGEVGTNPYQTSVRPATSVNPYVGLVLPILPRALVGEFSYQHDFVGDQKNLFPVGLVGRYFKQEANLYTARIVFAFGTR